jgi:hemolysin D
MLPSSWRPKTVDVLAGPIGAFESETQDVIRRTSPYSEHAIMHAVAGMLVTSLVLMSVVKLDRVVVANSGRVLPTGGSFFVQPLDKSMVSAIRVHAGDVVHKGQVLADLDPTFATADFKQLKDKVASEQALVNRLQDETAGRPYTATDPNDPYQALQASIYRQRQTEFQQGVADFDARISSDRSVLSKAHDDLQQDQQHLDLTSKLETMQRNLANKGWGSPALIISANDARVQAARQLGESRNTEAQSGHDLASLQAQRGNYVSKWHDDTATALVQARNDLSQAQQDYAKASRVQDLNKLVAPADAVVLNVAQASVGSVVDPATSQQSPLFTLTPLTGPLEADLHVDTRDVGFIRPGDKVRLKFDAYQFTHHGVGHGVVETISPGSFTQNEDNQTVAPYVKVRVRIVDAHLRDVPKDFRLLPGMTLSGDILEGGRTIMAYVLESGLRTSSEAMREP